MQPTLHKVNKAAIKKTRAEELQELNNKCVERKKKRKKIKEIKKRYWRKRR